MCSTGLWSEIENKAPYLNYECMSHAAVISSDADFWGAPVSCIWFCLLLQLAEFFLSCLGSSLGSRVYDVGAIELHSKVCYDINTAQGFVFARMCSILFRVFIPQKYRAIVAQIAN